MPEPQQAQSRPAVTLNWPRLLFFIAFACFLIAALTSAAVFSIGPAWAWGFGGFAAVALAWFAP